MVHKVQSFLHRLEPIALLGAYVSICVSAWFAWFSPLGIQNYLSHNDSVIQGILFTIGGILCIIGHITKIMIIELLGLISAVFGTYVFIYVGLAYVITTSEWEYGQIIGFLFLAMFLMMGKAFRLQHEISAFWLKPPTDHLYQ